MKALIFNSGLGSRLGDITKDKPKSMVRMSNGESIFERQLRILHGCGITDFIVTTGPFKEQLKEASLRFEQLGCTFTFVENKRFSETNYIYSMYLAKDYLKDADIVMLHGDLVFDANYAQMVIDSSCESLGSVNASLPLPEKDFKARVLNGAVHEVSVDIFDDDCVAFQPFYKLSKQALRIWLDEIIRFIDKGNVTVYAENAANKVFDAMNVVAFSYENHFVEEVDTCEDLKKVSSAIRRFDFTQQPVFESTGDGLLTLFCGDTIGPFRDVVDLSGLIKTAGFNKPLLVCGNSFDKLYLKSYFKQHCIHYTRYSAFSNNPMREEVLAGAQTYLENGCDSIISVGGGSAIDVAKSIIMHLTINPLVDDATEEGARFKDRVIQHLAIPTTAGTGSESTHFSVMYVDGLKLSLAHDRLLPNYAVLDSTLLASLPNYQKKATFLDALCQAIESYWSASSTTESQEYAKNAIASIVEHWEGYLSGDPYAAKEMLHAANNAGKAINLTKTTAAHAMCYMLSSLYGIAHGHAAALCLPATWQALIDAQDASCAPLDLSDKLATISIYMDKHKDTGSETTRVPSDGLKAFVDIYKALELDTPTLHDTDELEKLVNSVNTERLSNFPITLDKFDLKRMYESILKH